MVGARRSELAGENPLLIDPCVDDPEQHLIYLSSGEVVAVDERGRVTIDVFALNRADLVTARKEAVAEALENFKSIVRAYRREEYGLCAGLLVEAYSSNRPYAAVHRQYVNQRAQVRWRQFSAVMDAAGYSFDELVGDLPRITARKQTDAADAYFGSTDSPALSVVAEVKYQSDIDQVVRRRTVEDEVGTRSFAVGRVQIKNFRAIRDLELDLRGQPGHGNWTVLLGENGVGKTSILQAIALALAGPSGAGRTGLRPAEVLRQGAREGFVRIELTGVRSEVGLDFRAKGDFRFYSDISVPLAGYGATRLLWSPGAKQPKFSTANIENLFNPFVSLSRTQLWIPEVSHSDFQTVATALKSLLNAGEEVYISRSKTGELFLHDDRTRIQLSRLSSGYQAVAALALDLIRVFLARWGSVEAAEGIVLVDEIETHLHPRWQMRVVDSLRSAFPRVQFVATSHSPLTLRGLRDGEVIVLRRGGSGASVQQDLPPIEGMTVDQLLTSETFGLQSTLDPDIEAAFERYYRLLAQENLSQEDGIEIAELREFLGVRRMMGETRRERLLLEAIDRFLAVEDVSRRSDSESESSDQLRIRLAELWASEDG